MNKIKCVILSVALLVVASNWVLADSTTKDLTAKEKVIEKSSTATERPSSQGIPCNWSGWKNSFPEVKCSYNRCSKYSEILMMKCSDGFLTEVKAKRVCAGCDQI